MSLIHLVCAECKREVVGIDRLTAVATITGFTRDAEGKLTPEWSGGATINWDSQLPFDPQRPFACSNSSCDKFDVLVTVEDLVEIPWPDEEEEELECGNCGNTIKSEDDLLPVSDLLERVSPGEIMPAGECPDCGALVHLKEE